MSEPYVHFLNEDPVTSSMRSSRVKDGDYWIAGNGLMVRNSDEWERAGENDSLQSLWTTIMMKGNRLRQLSPEEQRLLNPCVVGSNPTRSAKQFVDIV